MPSISKILTIAAAFAVSGAAANAATIYATSVMARDAQEPFQMRYCAEASRSTSRSDICNGLGVEDVDGPFQQGGFLSTGNFDSVEFLFGRLVQGPIKVWEVTGNRNPNYLESVLIEAYNSATDETRSAELLNQSGIAAGPDRFELTFEGANDFVFDAVRFTDTSTNGGDGFDIDAVAVAAVPLPAGLVLFGTALAGLGLHRRRT